MAESNQYFVTVGEETRGRLRETVRPTRNKRGWKGVKLVLPEPRFKAVFWCSQRQVFRTVLCNSEAGFDLFLPGFRILRKHES